MQLGSNDLTDSDPLHVGSAIEDFVRLLHDTYDVKVVCVCQTIMRQGAVVFNRKAKLLTKYLRVVLPKKWLDIKVFFLFNSKIW